MNYYVALTVLSVFVVVVGLPVEYTPLKIGTYEQHLHFNGSIRGYKIKTNYKHLLLTLKSFTSIHEVLITDQLNYNDITKCASHANICQSKYI